MTVPNIWLSIPLSPTFAVDDRFDVVSIESGDSHGLRIGDRIDEAALTPFERLEIWVGFADPGPPLVLTVHRGDHTFSTAFRNDPVVTGSFWYPILKRGTATIFILVAAVLLLRRPSTMLWGFFLYALGSANSAPHVANLAGPVAMSVVTVALECIYAFCAPLGFLLFSTRFPSATDIGLRPLIRRMTPWIALLLLIPVVELFCVALGVGLPPLFGDVSLFAQPAVLTIAMIALVAGFMHLGAPQRQQLRWAVTAFAIFYVAELYYQWGYLLPGGGWPAAMTNAGWAIGLVNCTVILIPATVAYAILVYRVLDIGFILSRGLVYGVVTSIAVAIFAIVDWLISGVLAQSRLAVAGDIVAAIAIGFWLNSLHGAVDRFMDAVVFRVRHLAEQRIGRVTAGLPHAQDLRSVAALAVREPVAALDLLSGAFFRRASTGAYDVVYADGLLMPADYRLDASDTVFVQLYGERGPVFLHHVGWQFPGLPPAESSPVVALPIFVRSHLEAVVFYGGHRTGEAIDPDEIGLLKALCVGASAALDHLEADELRHEVEDLRRQLDAYKLAEAVDRA